jgi:pimeloyl-ACP methyl ester carboxylesterase
VTTDQRTPTPSTPTATAGSAGSGYRRVAANGIEIAYETFGDRTDPPVLLVMGLGTQSIAWHDELCADIAARGRFVVRFDNRDVGESTHLRGTRAPSPVKAAVLRRAPYTIADMADDAAGLLDALELDSAHVVGASMGGFIAQTVALRHPRRVRSLTLVMTSTGGRRVGQAKVALIVQMLRRKPARSKAEAMDAAVETFRAIGSPGYPFDETRVRDLAARSYDRGYDAGGFARQLAAVVTQPNRTRALRRLHVPTVVLHGLDDPLVDVSGGLALADAIPRAQFVGFAGMGHDLPRDLWPRFVDEIVGVSDRAERRRGR